nr:hypothetical protein [Tanacetum cinerariifolium]
MVRLRLKESWLNPNTPSFVTVFITLLIYKCIWEQKLLVRVGEEEVFKCTAANIKTEFEDAFPVIQVVESLSLVVEFCTSHDGSSGPQAANCFENLAASPSSLTFRNYENLSWRPDGDDTVRKVDTVGVGSSLFVDEAVAGVRVGMVSEQPWSYRCRRFIGSRCIAGSTSKILASAMET